MIDFNPIQQVLKEKTGMAYFNGSRSELICRCPICERNSNKNHGHLYIKTTSSESEMPVYNCFRCSDDEPRRKGTILKLLRLIGEDPIAYLPESILSVKNRGYIANTSDYYKKDFGAHKYNLPKDEEDIYKLKKQYLRGRLGFDFKLDKLPGLILNVREFIQNNNIDMKERINMLDYYEDSFVGFVSTRGTQLHLRNIDASSSFRYAKMDLTESKTFFKDFYGVKTNRPKMNATNTIVLCEGIFDLMVSIEDSAFNELRRNSCLWAAILGSGFSGNIASVLDYCKLTSANFVILSDSNRKPKHYKFFDWHPAVKSFDLYWNRDGSDFGERPIQPVKMLIDRRWNNVTRST
ncbi:MAG: hypothetical protein KAS32_14165 [Candidatus Peribacteraceae bacterium]|nr:hypothetical protein [Candidatus Peribacteraceae bacterium]